MFNLHPTLERDTVEVATLDLCRVLLMRDKTYPWVILVPVREGMRDLDDLNEADRIQAIAEMDRVAKAMKTAFKPYKMNVGALGNMVEQLHIHIIARFQDDPAWPGPVWGVLPPVDYTDDAREAIVAQLAQQLRGE